MNRYTSHTLRCLWVLLLLLLYRPASVYSQNYYPVHVNVQVLPPYGVYLTDYYSANRDRLIVTLLNRDKQQRPLQVKLRVRIKNSSSFQLSSRDELYYPMITLESGVPLRLTGIDLGAYLSEEKIRMEGRLNEGKLPTGMTEFSVQALDYATGRVLSDWGTGRAWLEMKQPPTLNIPLKNEQVAYRTPQQIRFQWMPRHQGLAGTEYEFVLKELPNNGSEPQSAFSYGQEIYRTRTRFTTLNYTQLEPSLIPGKMYGWQIRAIAKDGADEIGMFENNGFSEVGWFELNDNCPAPTQVTAKGGYRKMTLTWNSLPEQRSFVVEYRPKSEHSLYEWTSVRTFDTTLTAYDLTPGWKYEYRVGALCMTDKPVYSSLGEITLSVDNEERLAQCGVWPDVDFSNKEGKENLAVGEVVIVGRDFPMVVTQVSPQGNGWYSGKGHLVLSWIFDKRVAVQFSRLRINTDNRQIDGEVETETDPNASNIGNTNELDYGGKPTTAAKVVIVTKELDFTIPAVPEASFDPESGELIVFDTEGEPHVIATQKNDGESIFPMIVEDADGNKYQIDAPPVDDSAASDADGDHGTSSGGVQKPVITPIKDASSGFNKKALSDKFNDVITFNKGDGKYAFDAGREPWYETAQLISQYYHSLGKNYIAPWKLIPVGESDVVEAELSGTTLDRKKVSFVLGDGTALPAREVNGKWELKLPSVQSGETYEVFALYEDKKNKYETLGKLNVVSYSSQRKTVTLVPVNGSMPDVSWTERELNRIYNPYGIEITVKTDPVLKNNTEWDEGKDGVLNLNGSGFFTKETKEMRKLRTLYEKTATNYDRNAYYIFVMNRATAGDEPDHHLVVQGDMPRGKQFGYIFMDKTSNTPRLIAHELGHGMFTLRHSFDVNYSGDKFKSTTGNLMDYNNGEDLAVWQWNILAHPAPLTWFDSKDDGKVVLEPSTKAIARLIRSVNCALKSNEKEVSLYVPNVVLVSKVSDIENELNLAGSNCPDAELKVTLQDNYGEVKDFGNDYLGDNFGLSNIQYDENKAIVLTGKKYKLYISSSKDAACVYSFVKSCFVGQLIGKTPINFASLDELQYASPCELEQLSIENRVELLKKVSQETNWYNGSLKDSRQKISVQLLGSTPEVQQSKLLLFLHTNPAIVTTLYTKVDDYRVELINVLFELFVKNQQALNDLKTVSFALSPGLVEHSKKEFSEYVWGWLYTMKQQTTASFTGSNLIEVKSKQYRGMSIALTSILKEGQKQFEGRPFDIVQMIDPKSSSSLELPLLLYKYAADESSQQGVIEDIGAVSKQTIDIGLLCIGLKNLSGISAVLKKEVTTQNVARLILGSADLLSLGLGSVCANSESEFCKAYKEYELLINCGLLSASILNEFPQIYNGLKKGLDNSKLSNVQRQKLANTLENSSNLDELDKLFRGARQRAISQFGDEAEYLIYKKFIKDGGAAAEIIDHYGIDGLNALKKVTNIQESANELIKGKIGYRYINSDVPYISKLKSSGIIPANKDKTYFTLDRFTSPKEALQKAQLPNGDIAWRLEFDTQQIIGKVEFPYAKYKTGDYLEPICRSYPDLPLKGQGTGGATQFLTNSEIKLIRMVNIKTGEIINF